MKNEKRKKNHFTRQILSDFRLGQRLMQMRALALVKRLSIIVTYLINIIFDEIRNDVTNLKILLELCCHFIVGRCGTGGSRSPSLILTSAAA